MNCPKCGYAMSDFDVDCPRCKRMGTRATPPASARTQQPQVPQAPPVQRNVQYPSNVQYPGTVTTVVQVQQSNQGTPWWIFLLIFGGPIGCLAIPILFFGGTMLCLIAAYCSPLIIAGGISWWIWAKHQGTRVEKRKYIWITMSIGTILTMAWILCIILANVQQ
jgi:hypothetical protein